MKNIQPVQPTWFVVESGGDEPSAIMVEGIQHVADRVHDCLCICGGIRWIDCEKEETKKQVGKIFEKAQWSLASNGEPLSLTWHLKVGYISVCRITEPFPVPAPPHGEISSISLKRDFILAFSVPLLPPSVNHYKMPNGPGRGYRITPAARAFIDAVPVFARPAAPDKWPWSINLKVAGIRPLYEVDLVFYVHRPKFFTCDSDNLEKVAFDALTRCGAITDDRYIKFHTNRAIPVEEKDQERTEYTVRIVEASSCQTK